MTLINTTQNQFPSFNNLFGDFFNTELSDWKRNNYSRSNTTLPKVNILENDNEFKVEMAAPGMRKEDFNLKLDQNLLTISSEKIDDQESEGIYTKKEFAYQSFQRVFTLPEMVNEEKIQASYENGILKVTIPKKEEAKPKPPKKIKIA